MKKSGNISGIILMLLCAGAVIGAFAIMVNIIDQSGNEAETFTSAILSTDEAETVQIPVQNKEAEITVVLENNSNNSLTQEISCLITDYITKRYQAMSILKTEELSQYFDTADKQGEMYAAFNNATLDYLIYVRKNRTADFTFDKAEVEIIVTDISEHKNVYTIDFYINDTIYFNFTDIPSCSAIMETQAKVKKDSDGFFRFTQLAEDTDVNLLLEEKAVSSLGYDYDKWYLKDIEIPESYDSGTEILKIAKELKLQADEDIKAQAQQLSDYNASPWDSDSEKSADNTYDRDKAVSYSYDWVSKDAVIRNNEFSDYSAYGGNCQNYASQCILAGGVPMDIYGDFTEQWKWYGENSNSGEEEHGRSGSWTGTEYFYEYCNINTGYGLVADTSLNIYSAQPGDIIQYVIDGWAHHSVVVTKVIKDENGNVTEILANSNTTERIDFPVTAYGYTNLRLIHIVGYNN